MKTKSKNINGVTLKDITRMMSNLEKVINWFNKKYNFEMELATDKEQKKYNSALSNWDFLKVKRDELKFA